MYKIRIYSPNKSCSQLRDLRLNQRIVLRFGSSKEHNTSGYKVLNSIEGVKISSDKRKSARIMDQAEVHHAEWICSSDKNKLMDFYREHGVVICKRYNSCKGNGIYYIDSEDKMINWIDEHDNELNKFVIEKYYNFNREYRFHVDRVHGIFYGCRKLLKNDSEETWHRHDSNSVWILPENPKFKKPVFIDEIEADCMKYMELAGIDICAFDIKSNNDSFIILESNTAPCLGPRGIEMYKNHLLKYYNESI